MANIINPRKGIMKKKYILCAILVLVMNSATAASVVATVNGNPITDADITARTELMAKQGNVSATNRRDAFKNIVDDYVKLNYAANFNVKPTDDDANQELKKMNLGEMNDTMRAMARLAIRSDIAWGVVMARTVVPTIDVSREEIKSERRDLIRERGLPIEMEIIRLVDVPTDVVKKLGKPKNCDAAVKMVEDMGGYPQRFTAVQYELSADIRNRIADLPLLTWSDTTDDSVLLICRETKTSEYKNLDDIIKQNATYRKAAFVADQQLKQLRRKAVIIINDDRYKL